MTQQNSEKWRPSAPLWPPDPYLRRYTTDYQKHLQERLATKRRRCRNLALREENHDQTED